jgi:hypothetical protein
MFNEVRWNNYVRLNNTAYIPVYNNKHLFLKLPRECSTV